MRQSNPSLAAKTLPMSSPRSNNGGKNQNKSITRSIKDLGEKCENISDTQRKNMNGFIRNSPSKYMNDHPAGRISINTISSTNIRKGVGMSLTTNMPQATPSMGGLKTLPSAMAKGIKFPNNNGIMPVELYKCHCDYQKMLKKKMIKDPKPYKVAGSFRNKIMQDSEGS